VSARARVLRILILGGTGEASELAARLASRANVEVISSLAGRVANPALPAGEVRIGGFGGSDGLRAFLLERSIDAMVDATHPFAAAISRNAFDAARAARVPLLALERPAWEAQNGDRWHPVADAAEAARVVPRLGARIFLTLGRQTLAPFAACAEAWFLIRAIEPPDGPLPPQHELLLARGPFRFDDELALLRERAVDVIVSKNSGGAATSAKIAAARELGLPVVLVSRPVRSAARAVNSVAAVLTWIDARVRESEGAPWIA
jgi:precorrin-6A/cobalt-precorrin-6A reductase